MPNLCRNKTSSEHLYQIQWQVQVQNEMNCLNLVANTNPLEELLEKFYYFLHYISSISSAEVSLICIGPRTEIASNFLRDLILFSITLY